TYKFSLLPTGVLQPHLKAVIANGVVVNPVRFFEEVGQLRESGVAIGDNLIVSDHAHLIFPYHVEEERLTEANGEQTIGTTGRGIGPCYADKATRTCAVRVGELLHPERLRERLRAIVARKNRLLRATMADARQFDADDLCAEYLGYGEQLRPFVRDTFRILHRALDEGKRVLFEAAQGTLLDVDHGTYPYVTSSNSSTAGVWSGSGVPARNLNRVIGVIKAYTTRVGRGPFPTELTDGPDGIGELIRRTGREYGTVTGRPRRCGWFDAVATRYATMINGIDELAVTNLDGLDGVDPIKVCVAYRLNGKRLDVPPSDAAQLENCEPIYREFPGWKKPTNAAKKFSGLPAAARTYVRAIAELTGAPLRIVSVGPTRNETIIL
ncbi:MAG TPA: adenylosuccinate synthase, partial [Mycobacteriales bacterium]|nr:adenylosuccinate synthase [Mycobacteriales bacterium]